MAAVKFDDYRESSKTRNLSGRGSRMLDNNLIPESSRGKILKYIFQQKKTTRQKIARDLHLSMPTVLQSITEMEKENLVRENGLEESRGGRKAAIITAVEDNAYTVGVNITNHHISIIIINMATQIIVQDRIVIKYENNSAYYSQMFAIVLEFVQAQKLDPDKIKGVGFSIPGILNEKGTIITESYMLQIAGMPCSAFSRGLPWPASFTNDANAAVIAEMQSLEHDVTIFYLALNNSVGGAFIINGQIFTGLNQRAGEVGHIRLNQNGKKCHCGQKGCADLYCSSRALTRYGEYLDTFFDRLNSGDEEAQKKWKTYLDNLALLITDIRMVLDCDIILGGYVGNYIEPWIMEIQERVSELDPYSHKGDFYIHASNYKLESSAYGASIMALEKYVSELF